MIWYGTKRSLYCMAIGVVVGLCVSWSLAFWTHVVVRTERGRWFFSHLGTAWQTDATLISWAPRKSQKIQNSWGSHCKRKVVLGGVRTLFAVCCRLLRFFFFFSLFVVDNSIQHKHTHSVKRAGVLVRFTALVVFAIVVVQFVCTINNSPRPGNCLPLVACCGMDIPFQLQPQQQSIDES